jgi:hypothetical protein
MMIAIAAAAFCSAGAQAMELEIGGHAMVTASHLDADERSGDSSTISDLNVNSLELGMRFSPLRQADVNVVWLLEEEPGGGRPDDGFVVDQAFITLSGNGRMLAETGDRDGFDDSPWYMQAGKMYLPFSTFFEYHTFDVISEPETLQLGETLETSVLLGYSTDTFNVFGAVFGGRGVHGNANPAADGDDDELNDFLLGGSVDLDQGTVALSWMSNLNNSIGLVDTFEELADDEDPAFASEDEVGGLNVYGGVDLGPARLQISYVTALDDYTVGSWAGNRPSALWGELTFGGLAVGGRELAVTGVYGQTDEWAGHAESTYGVVVDTALADGITLAAQYLHREYDEEFGGGLDTEDLFALQLTAEFGWISGN